MFEEGNATVNNEMARLNLNRQDAVPPAAPPAAAEAAAAPIVGSGGADGPAAAAVGLRCSTAPGEVFETRDQLLAHYKTAWHKHNLQRKAVPGLALVSREEFDAMTPDQVWCSVVWCSEAMTPDQVWCGVVWCGGQRP